MDAAESFLEFFESGDVDGATALLTSEPGLLDHSGYTAHPLLRKFVEGNRGHCYKRNHLLIAEQLISDAVRSFRNAVMDDRVDGVRNQLRADPDLVHAEFTGGRGIAQAIHHWPSIAMGELLLESGADINALNTVHAGETPLVLKARFGSVDDVRFLLERGADPNLRPQMHMPSETMSDVIRLLLDYDWDIQRGHQLLHDANHGHGKRIIVWLEHGVDPTSQNETGDTALHILAAKGVGREAIRALVDAGAGINHKAGDGNTPLDLARRATRKAAEKELAALGAKASNSDGTD